MGFTCSVCGQVHDKELRDVRMGLPDAIHSLDDEERAARTWLADDFAVLDESAFFVRGLLEIPIREARGYFGYGAWVEVTSPTFNELLEHWLDPDQFAPVDGTLANELAPYDGTAGLSATLRPVSPSRLPVIELQDDAHELVRDQRDGITIDKSHELAATVLHR